MNRPKATGRPTLTLGFLLVLGTLAAGLLATSHPPKEKLVLEEYWFHGDDVDQVNKLARLDDSGTVPVDAATPTFNQDAPTGGEPVVQTSTAADSTAGGAVGPEVGNPASAYWVGDFTGRLRGEIELTMFLQTTFNLTRVAVRVYADPDWQAGTGTLLSEESVFLPFPGQVNQVDVSLTVDATVEEGLVVQVTPLAHLSDGRDGVTVFYDAGDFASGFVLPTIVPCEEDDPHPDCQE